MRDERERHGGKEEKKNRGWGWGRADMWRGRGRERNKEDGREKAERELKQIIYLGGINREAHRMERI